MEQEVWKPVIGYEWLYEVSSLGRVKSTRFKKEKILKCWKPHWYPQIKLQNKLFKIHRLVAHTFIPNIEKKPMVNHKNWIRDDNRVVNLEWCTWSENLIHSIHISWNKTSFQKSPPYKWKFWKENIFSIKVNQFSKEWNLIKSWWWACEASRMLWISQPNITGCCKWRIRYAWWFIWKYS